MFLNTARLPACRFKKHLAFDKTILFYSNHTIVEYNTFRSVKEYLQ